MNQEFLDRVLNSKRLPSLPAIALEVIDLVKRDDADIKKIAATIQNDPALSSKILKTVNSSFYGQAYSISTVSHALVVLGLKAVKTLALGFSLVNNLKDRADEGFDLLAFWKRSLLSATASKQFAEKLGLAEAEEAFLGGLLQDMGMLAMNQTLGAEYDDLLAEASGDHFRLVELEIEAFEADHAQVGGALAESWMLPDLLVSAIRYHLEPDNADLPSKKVTRCVSLGCRAAEVFMADDWGDDKDKAKMLDGFRRRAESWFGWEPDDAEAMLCEIHKLTNDMKRLFELPTAEMGNPDTILAQANEALLSISMEAVQETVELEKQNAQLTEDVYTDTLTQAANRRKFNEFLADQYDACEKTKQPISVAFLDADHFKKFNDTYGHPTGDRVLITLAATLKSVFGEQGLVCRYGGEEFAVIMPLLDRKEAAKLAESARCAIEAAAVESDEGEELHITASIGVACQEGGFFKSSEQLVKAADNGVYAAKKSGRNAVRVFVPRPAKKTAA
ncbi:MAG: GGDEF domain-containing protein [Planctomycetota bacterium]